MNWKLLDEVETLKERIEFLENQVKQLNLVNIHLQKWYGIVNETLTAFEKVAGKHEEEIIYLRKLSRLLKRKMDKK